MKVKIIAIFFLSIFPFCFYSCEYDEMDKFAGEDAIAFVNTREQLSFIANPDAEKETMIIPMRIIGLAKDYDRVINVEAIKDHAQTNAPDSHYKILHGTVKAGEYEGKLHVDVYNAPELKEKVDSLRLRVIPSKDFQIGNKENSEVLLIWTAKLVQPSTWNAMRFFFCARYSSNVYRAIIASCGITEFWYYIAGPDGTKVSEAEGHVLARKFGNWVRAYNAAHPGEPYRHDDGRYAGEEIIPIH